MLWEEITDLKEEGSKDRNESPVRMFKKERKEA